MGLRYAHLHGNTGEEVGFGFGPHRTGNDPEPTRKNEQGSPAVQKQLGSTLGYPGIVAAQYQNRIGFPEGMIHVVIIPERLGQFANARIYHNRRLVNQAECNDIN